MSKSIPKTKTNDLFRHLYGEEPKANNKYTDIIPAVTSGGCSSLIKCSGEYFAYASESYPNTLIVQNMNNLGSMAKDSNAPIKISLSAMQPTANNKKVSPKLSSSKSNTAANNSDKSKSGKNASNDANVRLLDWQFSPFYENMIAMSNSEGNVCVATIPKDHDPKNKITEPIANFGVVHKDTRANLLQWHPCAKSILASAGYDRKIQISNVETGQVIQKFESNIQMKGETCSIAWNRDGTLMAVGTHDGQMTSYDPRFRFNSVVKQAYKFDGEGKSVKVFWLPRLRWLGATGFNKDNKRVLRFWDQRDFRHMMYDSIIDGSSPTLMPYFDNDTSILYLWGKPDPNITFATITNDNKKYNPIGKYKKVTPQRGGCFVPKRILNVNKCEIARFLKLTKHKKEVRPISFYVRKNGDDKNSKEDGTSSSSSFRSDLYPNALSNIASMTADDYIEGNYKKPILMSLNPKDRHKYSRIQSIIGKNEDMLKLYNEVIHISTMEQNISTLFKAFLTRDESVEFVELLDALVELHLIHLEEEKEKQKQEAKEKENDDTATTTTTTTKAVKTKKKNANVDDEPEFKLDVLKVMNEIRFNDPKVLPLVCFIAYNGMEKEKQKKYFEILFQEKYAPIVDINAMAASNEGGAYDALLYSLEGLGGDTGIFEFLLANGINPNKEYIVRKKDGMCKTNILIEIGARRMYDAIPILLPMKKEKKDKKDEDEKKNENENKDENNKRVEFRYVEFINKRYDNEEHFDKLFIHHCCLSGVLKNLKYILQYEECENIAKESRMDIYAQTKQKNENCLMLAYQTKNFELQDYLLNNYQFNINHQCNDNGDNRSVLHICISNIGKWGSQARRISNGGDVLGKQLQKSLSQLLNYNRSRNGDDKISVYIQDLKGVTPLVAAIRRRNTQSSSAKLSASILTKCINILIDYQLKPENAALASLSDLAEMGDIFLFRKQMFTLLKTKYNASKWDDLTPIGINEESIDKWMKISRDAINDSMVGFLTNLKQRAFNTKSVTVLYSMVDVSLNKESDQNKTKENENNTKLANKTAHYLYKNCDKHTLTTLAKVINNGIVKQECGFDDSLLFLSKMVDNEAFIQNLEQCTADCLRKETKNSKKYLYFKNNLLNSKVWGTMEKNVNNDDSNNNNDNDGKNSLLFEKTEQNVIENELKSQREFIKNSIIKQEKEWNESWKQLTTFKEEINGLLVSKVTQPIDADFQEKELPFDNVNGFNGSFEYDNNAYLTKLLLFAHKVDPVFQKDCQRIFGNKPNQENNFLQCSYTAAPPKTKDRAQRKAQLEYQTDEWPFTKSIVDLVRCSVVFKNSKDLMHGVNTFIDLVDSGKAGTISEIVRIKNGFKDFKFDKKDSDGDESKEAKETKDAKEDLSKYKYSDVKFNVAIVYNSIELIGEVQMMLEFMLEAKKIGHSVYSFVRNEDYYKEVSEYLTKSMDINEINQIIVSRNISSFSKMLENCSDDDKKNVFIKQQDKIKQFLNETHWKKGLKLFDLFLKSWQ